MTRLFPILAITFVDVLGFTLLIPLLPYYAEHYGAKPIAVGAILATVAVFAFLAGPVWGRISDRTGRRTVLIAAQCLSTLSYVLLGIGGSLLMIFVARAIEGVAGALMGVTQAYVADLTEPKDRARAFGWLGASFGLGFLFGPVLGGLLVRYGYPVPFYTAAALQVVTIILTVAILPESHRPPEHPPSLRDVAASLAQPALRTLLLQTLFFALSFMMWIGVFALFVERVLGFGPSQTSLLYMIPATIGVCIQLFVIGWLNDRFDSRDIVVAGLAFGVLGMSFLAFVRDLPTFLATIVCWSLANALLRPTLGAMISRFAPEDRRGTIMGVNDSLNSIALIVGPITSTTILSYNVH
ncbi:MAG: MFS transporter, partial [Candidatus Eremiobacteraeota bacterium]|nr:MFS transporter [Candidatus Eremiobacteraeota bacterium]